MKLKTYFFVGVFIASISFFSLTVSKNDESLDTALLQSMNVSAEKNWIISPVSIKSVLEEIYTGAGGKTKEQLGSVLAINNNDDIKEEQDELNVPPEEGVVWKRTNKILVKDMFPLKDSYKSHLISVFNAEVESTDFVDSVEISNSINAWVSDSTEGLISHLVDPGDVGPSNLMVLLNAVFFKGTWKYAFKEKATKERCFYQQPSKCSKVQMMRQKGFHKYGENLEIDAKILQLPYNDPRYSMVIVLPNMNTTPISVLSHLPYNKLVDYIKNMSAENIKMSIPKFKSSFKVTLNDQLQKIGLSSIFEASADFSEMTDSNGVYVSHVIHEAHISLNEKGTIAAAASTGGVISRSLFSEPSEYVVFNADHPFLYFILYNNAHLLFAGQYSG